MKKIFLLTNKETSTEEFLRYDVLCGEWPVPDCQVVYSKSANRWKLTYRANAQDEEHILNTREQVIAKIKTLLKKHNFPNR